MRIGLFFARRRDAASKRTDEKKPAKLAG